MAGVQRIHLLPGSSDLRHYAEGAAYSSDENEHPYKLLCWIETTRRLGEATLPAVLGGLVGALFLVAACHPWRGMGRRNTGVKDSYRKWPRKLSIRFSALSLVSSSFSPLCERSFPR